MSSIRDEISKIIDIRIPQGGFKRYIKEVSRTGGFQQRQHEDMLIVLAEAVEELQSQQVSQAAVNATEELQPPAFNVQVAEAPSVNPLVEAQFHVKENTCDICGKECASSFGLHSHRRSHKKDAPNSDTTKSNA